MVSPACILGQIENVLPHQRPSIQAVLDSINAQLVANMTTDESGVHQVADRIQSAADKMLGIQIGHPVNLAFQDEIRASTQYLIPAVARNPHGQLAHDLDHITQKLDFRNNTASSIN